MFQKIMAWCKKQWKAIVAFLGLVMAAAAMYFRSKDQKKILDYTSNSLKKEAEVNKKAEESLVEGLEAVSEQKDRELDEAEKTHAKKKRELDQKKKELIKDSSEKENLEDLAKGLADRIGADFVE